MKPRRIRFILLLCCAATCLQVSALLAYQQAITYRAAMFYFPPGSMIGGIPAGKVTAEQAGQRLAKAYTLTPVEILIKSKANGIVEAPPIQIDPLTSGQQLDIGGMLDRARTEQLRLNFWVGFWRFLWHQSPTALDIPLSCTVDEERLYQFLKNDISIRYEQRATRAQPLPGDVAYLTGQPGQIWNIDDAIPHVREALCSKNSRTAEIYTVTTEGLPPDPDLLKPTLEALIQGSGFDGVLELYFQDLKTGSEFSTAFNQGRPVEPGIAFTAASTIKIPVMVSAYKHIDDVIPDDLRQQMERMIDLSDNSSTDEVMQRVLDANLAPLQVTEDMQALGLKNTFLAGYFYQGAPLLNQFNTPANQRTDISTDPDIYNQTSAADMGFLLSAIQHCAENGNGPIISTYQGQVTQSECQEMIDMLAKNKKGVLLEAGLPEGVRMARKYGWVTDPADGLMHSASDAALVFTPGGDFVLTVYTYHPDQLQWDPVQRLVARLATAVNNYYNQWK